MTESRSIVLGTTTFVVPPLPIRYNRVVYPLCRDLSADAINEDESFFARLQRANGTPALVTDDEWAKLEQISFQAACAADKAMTRETFDDLPITPPQLIDAFFKIRLQTGVWIEPTATNADAGAPQGEAVLAEAPAP